MKIGLHGKTAIVIGSTRGVGLAVARGLALAGAEVVINGRDPCRLAAAIETLGGAARGVAADAATAGGCKALVRAQPRCDILVSTAAIFPCADFFKVSEQAWERHWEVNVTARVRLARTYLPVMKRSAWGRINFISADSMFTDLADAVHYAASQTADIAVMRWLAQRTADAGVTVNVVAPAAAPTEEAAGTFGKDSESEQPATGATGDFVSARPRTSTPRPATLER